MFSRDFESEMEKHRDYYLAELRKHPLGKSGDESDDVSTSMWPLLQNLSYLWNTMQTRPRFTIRNKINIETILNTNEEDLSTEV